MMTYWIPEEPCLLPSNASHQVGVGGFVINDKDEVHVFLFAMPSELVELLYPQANKITALGACRARETFYAGSFRLMENTNWFYS